MGICASCLSARQKSHSHEESPLLTPETPVPTYSDAQLAKQRQDLNAIIQKTHNRLIDVNIIGRPDMETYEEPVEALRKQLNAVEGAALWTWPQLRALSETEESIVDAVLQSVKEEPEFRLSTPAASLLEEF